MGVLTFHHAKVPAGYVSVEQAVASLKHAGWGVVNVQTHVAHDQLTQLSLQMNYLPPPGPDGKKPHFTSQAGVYEFLQAWGMK